MSCSKDSSPKKTYFLIFSTTLIDLLVNSLLFFAVFENCMLLFQQLLPSYIQKLHNFESTTFVKCMSWFQIHKLLTPSIFSLNSYYTDS